jgi:hypothetical protein
MSSPNAPAMSPCPGHFHTVRGRSQIPTARNGDRPPRDPPPAFCGSEVPGYQSIVFWEGSGSHESDQGGAVIGWIPLCNSHSSPPDARKLPTAGRPLVQVPGTRMSPCRPLHCRKKSAVTKATHLRRGPFVHPGSHNIPPCAGRASTNRARYSVAGAERSGLVRRSLAR